MKPQQHFTEFLESQNLSARYIKEMNLYYRYFMKEKDGLNQTSINRFLSKSYAKNGVARAFIKKFIEYIQFNREELNVDDEKMMKISIMIIPKIKYKQQKKIEILSKEQVYEILKIMKKREYRLLLMLNFWCGFRVDELVGLKVIDFDWDEWNRDRSKHGVATFVGKGQKIDSVFVRPEIMKPLREFIIKKKLDWEDKIFFTKMKNRTGATRWQEILREHAEKAIGRKVNPHLLRHSIATHLSLKEGWDIMEIKTFLRHSNISTTQKYTHLAKTDIEGKFNRLKFN